MSVPSPAGAGDEARDTDLLFNEGHDAVNGQCRDDVQDGDAQVDFDAA